MDLGFIRPTGDKEIHEVAFAPLNIFTLWPSKREMFLTLTVPSRDSLRWRFAPYWARVTVHKRLVLVLALCGALTGVLKSAATSPVYAAHVVILIDAREIGCCAVSSIEAPARPFPVRVASQIDAAVSWLRLPSPRLEHKVSKWMDKK